MKAMIYKKYGCPDVLEISEVEKPTPEENEVRIKVYAVEATKSDCELRSFKFPVKWFWLPLRIAFGWSKPKRQILGGYFAGEVESIGVKVSLFQVGDQVFGCSNLSMGCYAEYVCLPESFTIVPKPNNINFAQASTVPLGGLNALHFMKKAKIKPGEKVLINGAGGSIGLFGLQIAKNMGAQVTVVDSAIKQSMLLQLGADKFIDYQAEDFTNSKEKYDVIFDMVAKSSYFKCLKMLNKHGRYVTANPTLPKMIYSMIFNLLSSKVSIFALAGEKVKELIELKNMIELEKVKPVVGQVFSLERAADAHRLVEEEKRIGTIALEISPA